MEVADACSFLGEVESKPVFLHNSARSIDSSCERQPALTAGGHTVAHCRLTTGETSSGSEQSHSKIQQEIQTSTLEPDFCKTQNKL